MTLNFEEALLFSELKKRKPKRILVQLPEGIKIKALEMQEKIEKLGIEVIFSGETAWGGCCIAVDEAKKFDCDLIVHFGHAEFIKSNFNILYIEVKDELDLLPILKKSLLKLKKYKKLGLSYSVQHRHDVEKILQFYKDNGHEIRLSNKKGYAAYAGHVIGCEYTGLKEIQEEVDAFVIIGNRFHSVGAALAVKKPVILIDVYNDEVSDMEEFKERMIRERAISIDKLKHAKSVGIIVEMKPGQKFGTPKGLIQKFKDAGKKVVLITMNEMTVDKLANFYNIDAFVELACPRIAIDDFKKYPKPVLTYKEAQVALGEKTWEEFLEKGIV
ncbi:diphthamide biosynthesis enzyme Dph2 [Candidatus Pacearchaeota archaeon]|nr:diphthamide biosynthesis enzyme Dph2 [Candidatus Pacearchaeota archaeon]